MRFALLGGDTFQRVSGCMNGISQPTMQRTMLRVVMAINRNLKEEYLRMPTEAQLQANAAANVEKYGLPNFGYAVDGMHVFLTKGFHWADILVKFFNKKFKYNRLFV